MKVSGEPKTIAVVGGGQLCRMMAEAAAPLGYEIVFLDSTPNAPAQPVSRRQIVGALEDPAPLKRLLKYADFLTFDIELADADQIQSIDSSVPIHPNPKTLSCIQDKLKQKRMLQKEGIPTPDFRSVETEEDLSQAGKERGFPLMVKSRFGGYDGRGNFLLRDEDSIKNVFSKLTGPLMVEDYVDFERELAVIGAKNSKDRRVYPPTCTVHKDEILRHTVTPAPVSDSVKEEAIRVALETMQLLEGRGVFGIELFQTDGSILLNEIAPRPHNSGHWTIEGAVTSQFEQHVRAVTDSPLGSTELIEPSVTVNILGENKNKNVRLGGVKEVLSSPRTHFHWYGKKVERPLRKMGHFTVTGNKPREELLEKARNLLDKLRFST